MTLKFPQSAWNNKQLIIFCLSTIILFITTVTLAHMNTELRKLSQKSCDSKFDGHGLLPSEAKTSVNYRLPRHVVPTHYELLLAPNMFSKKFDGTVSISIQVLKATQQITLHSKSLIINSIFVRNNRSQNVKVVAMETLADKREFLHVNLVSMIHQGNYTLQIKFKGLLNGLTGFYASSLKNGGTMVASKFQPTYARQAFPCFDEPDFKATYDITLVKPPSYVALSNMNEISTTLDKDANTESVTFARSVPMSTYLACFVICDFDFKQTEINAHNIGNNFKLRTFAQKNQMHKIDFALDIGKRATEFYIQYYEVPFPLPKLDMIAIPDYASGATEHWGLITYRETSFLVDQDTASSKNKIAVANTIAHELAHMWFGNLVTNKWWDDLWLNEGFASYMQVKSLNAIQPSWTMLDQFLIKSLHGALTIDAKLTSHPIVQVVATPDQITAIFDAISYSKGASVLRMLEGFIGEENFRRGVSDYLTKYQFGNTITQDLLSSLEPYFQIDNPGLSLTHIMDTWTRQMGYPLLTVKKGAQPNTFVISQSRFLIDPHANYKNDSPYSYRWFIPITYKTDKGLNEKILWFSDTMDNVKLDLKDEVIWLKINNNQVGYYRVNYPHEMWEQLIHQLHEKSEKLTISDRAHLLNEVFALAEAQIVSYDLAMNLTTYLVVEKDYVPWETAASIFKVLEDRLRNSLAHEDLQKYIQKLIEPLYRMQSWEKKKMSVIEGLLRTRILSLATRVQLADAETKVRGMFLHWLNNRHDGKVEIEPDLRDFVYVSGMKSASMSEWDKLWQIYLNEEDAQELTKLRSALAAPRDTAILKKYLTLAWDEKYVRSQDYLGVVQAIAANPSGAALVWDDVRARWPQLVDRFSLNSRYLGNLVPAVTRDFNTQLKLKEMEAWFAQYPEAGAGEAGRRRALETVPNNIRWANSHQDTVTNWLKSKSAATTAH